MAASVLMLLLIGCTGAEHEIPDFARATALPSDLSSDLASDLPLDLPEQVTEATTGAVEGTDLGLDLRTIQFLAGQPVAFDIRPGDVSWSMSVTAAGPEDLVGIRRVKDPTGQTRYLADLRNELLLVDDLDPKVLADAGAIGLYVTSERDQPLMSGQWTADVVANDGTPQVTVMIRSGDTSATQVLDIAVWATTDIADPVGLADAWRRQMDVTLSLQGLAVGELQVVPAGEAGASFAVLGVEGLATELHQACTTAAQAMGVGPRTAVVVLSQQIGEGVLTASADGLGQGGAYRRPDGEIDGFAVATPGTPVVGPTSHACVAVRGGENPNDRGLIALHEILHQAGLTRHTTEREGREFDLLPDTPECPATEFDVDRDFRVNRIECAGQDATNLLFWAVGGSELTADQTWRVRNHPLFHAPDQ